MWAALGRGVDDPGWSAEFDPSTGAVWEEPEELFYWLERATFVGWGSR